MNKVLCFQYDQCSRQKKYLHPDKKATQSRIRKLVVESFNHGTKWMTWDLMFFISKELGEIALELD